MCRSRRPAHGLLSLSVNPVRNADVFIKELDVVAELDGKADESIAYLQAKLFGENRISHAVVFQVRPNPEKIGNPRLDKACGIPYNFRYIQKGVVVRAVINITISQTCGIWWRPPENSGHKTFEYGLSLREPILKSLFLLSLGHAGDRTDVKECVTGWKRHFSEGRPRRL